MKWNSIGVKERIEEIEKFLSTSNRADKSSTAYRALKQLDTTITTLLSDNYNDENSLLTYRRQVRMMIRKLVTA